MKRTTLFSKLALAGCSLIVTTTIGRAQIAATLTDIGATAPVPGALDQAQVTYFGTGKPGGLNYYWDNGNPNGQTFTTGNNPGGYVLSSVALKTAGGGGSDGNPSGSWNYAQPFYLRIYAVSGVNSNSATLLSFYQSQTTSLMAEGNWFQMTGLNTPLSPNTTYAYTFSRSTSGYENLSTTSSNFYGGGAICEIPTGGGTINYGSAGTSTNYDATFDVGLILPTGLAVGSPIASAANPVQQGTALILTAGTVIDNAGNGTYTYQWLTDNGTGGAFSSIPDATFSTYTNNTALLTLGLNYRYQVKVTDSIAASVTSSPVSVNVIQVISGTMADIGTNTPSPGGADAFQLDSAYTYQVSGGLNYYDNATPAMGQTFTTGGNAKGYSMGSVAIEMAGGHAGSPSTGVVNGQAAGNTNQAFDLRVYSISTDGSTASEIADITNLNYTMTNGNWLQWSFPPVILTNNATYAYTFQRRNTANYCGMSTSDGSQDWYSGGQAVGIPNGGGALTYSSSSSDDGTFDITLIPNGVPFLLSPVSAAPNPSYALSPVSLACRPTTVGPNGYTFTYQWFTDDGSGATPPNYIIIPGATATNVTVVPQDMGYDYTTNYYFVATDYTTSLSVTSPPVVLTIHAASPPQLTDPTPVSLTTFAGGNVTYVAGEIGTLPITNQWQANYGSGYAPILGGTNLTLVLANLQTTDSGTYELRATNLFGGINAAITDPVTLIVQPVPAGPNPASQIYFNHVYTNSPWAYWRLNEAGNPSISISTAYDYAGHNFNSTYGANVALSLPGPQPNLAPPPLGFPGFDSGETAVGTIVGSQNSYLTVPPLQMNGVSNVTFMAWINPGGPETANAALFFNRNVSDAAGFGFGSTQNHLGYTWNNNAATYNWDSGLVVPAVDQWNFVAYVITPTNATIYLGNLYGGTTNFYQSVNNVANTVETFNGGTTLLGSDINSINRNFNGTMCEAALFTNALTTLQVQQYFQAAIGASNLAPSIAGGITVAPAAATTTGVYSGQNVRMSVGNASGTFPITNRWQVSADGTIWSDVANSSTNSLLIDPQVTGTYQYHLVAANIAATVTSSPVALNFIALPSTPPGLWTMNFQETNNLDGSQNTGGGLGHYVGRGILGNGTYWNILPHILPSGSGYNANTLTSLSDLQDDGATHTGIYCQMWNGGSYNGPGGTLAYSSDVGNLINQFYRTYYSPGALKFHGVPAGTYNLVLYGGDGMTRNGANNYGTTFVVYDSVNGNQTNSTAEPSVTTDALSQGANFVIFPNVHISGDLNVDVDANTAASASASACVEGAQLQLVSYDTAAAPVLLNGQYVGASSTMTLTWSQGILETTTNLLTPWVPIYAPSPVSMTSTTNQTQFYRVQVHP